MSNAPHVEEPILLTMNQAAARLRVSPRSLQTLVYTGELRSVILGRRIRRVLVSDLERYVREAVEMQSLTTTQQTTGRGRRKRREAVG